MKRSNTIFMFMLSLTMLCGLSGCVHTKIETTIEETTAETVVNENSKEIEKALVIEEHDYKDPEPDMQVEIEPYMNIPTELEENKNNN